MLVLPNEPPLMSNEKVQILREYNYQAPGALEEKRWQVITVERNGRLLEFPYVLGPTKNYPGVEDILIISMGEDEVSYVMDTADAMRGANQLKDFLAEKAEESTLVEDYSTQMEQQRKALLNVTQLSAATGHMVQRTGNSRRR